jgi:hypothetical protein
MRTRINKPALLLSLLALGALGLVACGGDDDDQTTAASETKTTRDDDQTTGTPVTETTRDELAADIAADNKSCGRFGYRYKFAVVEGDVSCRVARGVMRGNAHRTPATSPWPRLPGSWSCDGPDARWVCVNEAEETIVAWCCGTIQREATYIALP